MESTTSIEDLTAEQRQATAAEMVANQETFFREIRGLTEEQWRFKPDADVWSIAEIAEHVAVVEQVAGRRFESLPNAALADVGRNNEQLDEMVRGAVVNRTMKVKTPSVVEPSGTWSEAKCEEVFKAARAERIKLLQSSFAFRGRVIPHPVMGPLDGHQWLLALIGHCSRHVAQIQDVKNEPGFPNG